MQITAEYIIVMIIIIILCTYVLRLIRMYSPKSCPLSRFHICTLHKPMAGVDDCVMVPMISCVQLVCVLKTTS